MNNICLLKASKVMITPVSHIAIGPRFSKLSILDYYSYMRVLQGNLWPALPGGGG